MEGLGLIIQETANQTPPQTSDEAARSASALVPVVYEELRALAYQLFRGQPGSHTLQPTALIHEAYVRLNRQADKSWCDRSEFLAAAARTIRCILVDHARGRAAIKRGGGRAAASLDENLIPAESRDSELLALDEALRRLAELDPQKAQLVELRFFAGLTMEDTAKTLAISPRSAYREWELARAWLRREMNP